MKSITLVIAFTALFTSMANANSGLADRINEARSYPSETAKTVNEKILHARHKELHKEMKKYQMEDKNPS